MKDNHSINVGLIRHIHLEGLYNQTPWPLEENKFIIELRGALEGIPLL